MNRQINKKPSIIQLFISFLRLGLTAFGGPAMVQYIKELSVKRNKWVDEETFNEGIALCQSIPGATAIQMAKNRHREAVYFGASPQTPIF